MMKKQQIELKMMFKIEIKQNQIEIKQNQIEIKQNQNDIKLKKLIEC